MKEVQALLNEVTDQANNPPGNDKVLGAFYSAVGSLLTTEHPFASLILDGIKCRKDNDTPKHLVNLIYRAFQAAKFNQQDLSYRTLDDPELWKLELLNVSSNPKSSHTIQDIISTRSTTTTIYQRYAGPYAVISKIFGDTPVTIADLGCGGNYGLRGIDIHEPFKPIDDQTPDQTVSDLLSNPIQLKGGIAVDKQNPEDEAVKKWRLACSFYPKELDQLESVIYFEDRLRRSERVRFYQADLLDLANWPKPRSANVIILSTILYQLSPEERYILLQRSQKLLKKHGIMIVQDFAGFSRKSPSSPDGLDFNRSWFGTDYGYRTFVAGEITQGMFLEALQWDNGRCNSVKQGRHFSTVFDDVLSWNPNCYTTAAS